MPVMTALTDVLTGTVVTVNVAEVVPAATRTEEGTDAAALPLDKATVVPLVPAGRVSLMVPVELVPPATELGASVMDWSNAGVIVNLAL